MSYTAFVDVTPPLVVGGLRRRRNVWRECSSWLRFEEDIMTIVRWDPFRDFGLTPASTWVPPVDIYESDDHQLVLSAELPDMSRENIDITVENFVLTIKGEKKFVGEVKEERVHHIERRYGTFSRSFTLPQTVDAEKVSAEYKNGVLTVRLPLREEAKPRQIKVDVAA
jgi:HSP20 family protein